MIYNEGMKKFLLGFLMFVMLTPGLVCGPFMGMGKAEAAQSLQGMENCEGMDSQKKASEGGHVFFKDCSKTDLVNNLIRNCNDFVNLPLNFNKIPNFRQV